MDFIADNDIPGAIKFFDNPLETEQETANDILNSVKRQVKMAAMEPRLVASSRRFSNPNSDNERTDDNILIDEFTVSAKNYK